MQKQTFVKAESLIEGDCCHFLGKLGGEVAGKPELGEWMVVEKMAQNLNFGECVLEKWGLLEEELQVQGWDC